MARDVELDRLRTVMNQAYERKESARVLMESAWQRRVSARDAMNNAYAAKQRAYEIQESSWQEYQRIRSANGPRIDSLNAQQERAYENMKRAFDNASAAHDRRDGAMAKSYATDGHNYKAESQRYVAERRQLVAEIRSARERHEATKPAFQQAKATFESAKHAFTQAKAEHERLQADFKQANAAFKVAREAYLLRLEKVKAEQKRRRDDKRDIARKAGVPSRYLDDVWVSQDGNGNTNIYFGGVGKPNGPGHGHYVVDRSGKVTYKRDPSDPHGAQNFEGPGKDGHRGGFGKSQHGWIGDSPVTFALGWGTKQGHTMIADGHLDDAQFRDHHHHDHYGPGDGPNNNGTLRRKYTGPGA